jgi:Immunity protein 26
MYPFEPRSNAYLKPGQFWAIPLSNGRFACGRVLASARDTDDPILLGGSRMIFLAALMDWVGDAPPTQDELIGRNVIAQGNAHVRTIRQTGGVVLGCRALHLDRITGLREVTHRGGGTVYLYEGATRLRAATREEAASLQVRGTWGFNVIRLLAEHHFVSTIAS